MHGQQYHSLGLHHHSAGNDPIAGTYVRPTPLVGFCFARKTWKHAGVMPPPTEATGTVVISHIIIVVVERRKFHSVVEVVAECTVPVHVSFILQGIAASPLYPATSSRYWLTSSPIMNDQYSAEYQRLSDSSFTSTLRR